MILLLYSLNRRLGDPINILGISEMEGSLQLLPQISDSLQPDHYSNCINLAATIVRLL
jgi:hypothetical protein